ncbi:MAG TPA: enoyl-CoA hydratase/isomerase family protein [Acidimicrobiales bacterium]|nr:enoyl-CoA hydratase/isomerase family protein [Acidimicrobiales bacterium]
MEAALEVTREGPVAVVRLARGKVNAIDAESAEEVAAVLDGLAPDEAVGAVVLTGAGTVFSAGVDLRRVVEEDDAYVARLIAALRRMFETLFAFPKPTVAAVNGAAVAGGCILACACDRRLVADGARIGATELTVGVAFPASALEILRHACGRHTEDVVTSARLLTAEEARAVGMAHEVVGRDALADRSLEVARGLASLAPPAYRLAKEQLRRPARRRMAEDGPVVDDEATRIWASPDTRERLHRQLERLGAR